MTAAENIKAIFESSEFTTDLEALSSYAANIRQERPIVVLFAKYFWRQGLKVALEKNKCDLVVNGTRIEFKVHFDSDMALLQRELNKYDGNLEMLMDAVSAKKHSPTWTVCPGIYKDVIVKRPDIFVWILSARDLSKLTDDEMDRVCMATQQQHYNIHDAADEFLEVVDDFLDKLQRLRGFSCVKPRNHTNGWFPSAYHLRICEFAESQDHLGQMIINRTLDDVNYIEPLKEGSVHVVAFAEEGFSHFKALAEFWLGLSLTKAVQLCNEINSKDETGTLWPNGKLTALPKRFFREEDFDEEGFRRCLRDAFIANRDYCKSNHLVFQFSCVQLHLDILFEEVKELAEQEFSDAGIERITVHFSS